MEKQNKKEARVAIGAKDMCVCAGRKEKSKTDIQVVKRESGKGTKLFLEANEVAGQLVHQVHAGDSASLLLIRLSSFLMLLGCTLQGLVRRCQWLMVRIRVGTSRGVMGVMTLVVVLVIVNR